MSKLIDLIVKGSFQKSNYASREEYFLETSEKLIESGKVDSDFYNSILEREKLYPTGLKLNGRAVAIPHTEHTHILYESVIIDVFEKPIKFRNIENTDEVLEVDMSFMLLLTKDSSHVEVLRQLIRLFNSEGLMDELYYCKTKQRAIEIISRVEDDV